jgi:hypothetical protein
MKKIAAIILFASGISAQAQDTDPNQEFLKSVQSYKTAVGVKLLGGAGLTVKHFIKEASALELLIAFQRNGSRITGLYEFHGPLQASTGLKWYAGPGAHISFNNSKTKGNYVGIDGVIGIEYKFPTAPVNISLDLQPSLEIGKGDPYSAVFGGFAVRYTF